MTCACDRPRKWAPSQRQLEQERDLDMIVGRDCRGPIPIPEGNSAFKLWHYPNDWSYRIDLGFHKCTVGENHE